MVNLTEKVIQKSGTHQCWWLSFLELVRRLDKLSPIFDEGGVLYQKPVPEENGNLVYGPDWQKVVMYYLHHSDQWRHRPNDTVWTSQRRAELEKLCNILHINNITIGQATNLTPSNVRQKFSDLQIGTRMQIDKSNHAMSGEVKKQDEDDRKVIEVYNQATGNDFCCWVKKTENIDKLLSKSGNTELNFWIVVS